MTDSFAVLDVETTGNEPWKHQLICVGLAGRVYRPDEGRAMARLLMARPGATIVAHTNYDLRWLLLDGARLAEGVHYHDTKVMAHALDATQSLALDDLAARYLGYVPPKLITRKAGRIMFKSSAGVVPIEEAPWEEVADYNRSDIETTAELYEHLRARMLEEGLWERFLEEEVPFSRLLVEMEQTGVPFDKEGCAEMLARASIERDAIRERLVGAVGVPGFNPGSGDQVAKFLYEEVCSFPVKFAIPRLNGMAAEAKLEAVQGIAPEGVRVERAGRDYGYGVKVIDGRGLRAPKIDKWKDPDSRPTVGAKVLNVMHGADPWVAEYLRWKQLDKLVGSFLSRWIEQEHEGRIHGRFDQSGTVTGRLSGREPNLQQVPNSEEWNVRDLFRGDLMVGDYAGLEVRLSAHFSHDPVMLEIFRGGKDLYGVLAANAWGGEETKENPGRGLMKVLMLSSQYGAQGEKLAEVLAFAGMRGYTPHKANDLLKDLERTLPRLFEWREEVIAGARALGYVTTLAGRRRHLPDINSAVWKTMATSERQAVNSVVQGSAADVVRRAMLRARREVALAAARIILQVHDEILWQRESEWTPEIFERLQTICETGHGFELDVPLVFEAKVASSWAEKGGSGGQAKAGEYAHVSEAIETAMAA